MRRTLWLTLCLLICVLTFSACDQGDKPLANDDTTTVCQHTFGDWNTTKQATCKDEGELVRVCSKCSAEEKTTVAKTNVHTEVIDAAISATCEATGLTEGKHCSVCGVVTVEQTTLPLASHTYDNDEDSRCNICDYVRDLNCQHTETEVLKAVTPTCTTSGLSEGAKCSSCGEIIVAQTSIPAKEHTPTTTAGYDATCTQTGLSDSKKCSVCDTELEKAIVIPIKPHEYTDKYDKSCNNCDFVRDAECAHTETITIEGKNATCTELGLTDGIKCTECGEILIAQTTVGTLGHAEVTDAAIAPTCTATGLTEGKHCSRCNATLVTQTTVGALGHAEVTDAAIAPTCTATGLTEGKHCSRCTSTIVAQTVVKALGHIEVIDAVVAPTCTDTGLTEGKHCSRCSTTLVAQTTVGSLGHIEVIDSAVAPTCTATGLTEGKHCSRCNATLVAQTTIGALGHIEVTDSAVAPTCTETGLTEGKHCSRCTEVIVVQKEINRAKHNFDDGICICGTQKFSQDLGFYLSSDKTYYSIKMGKCKDSEIIIPSTYNGLPVTTIDVCAFDSRYNDTTNFNSIVIPSSITHIDRYAFYGCDNLKSVYIENLSAWCNLEFEDVYDNPLNYASKLYVNNALVTDLIIPDNVKGIGRYAFVGHSGFVSIYVPQNVTRIEPHAFQGCDNVKSVVLPRLDYDWTLVGTSITQHYDLSLDDIGITKNVEYVEIVGGNTISMGAFENYNNIKTIVLPFIGGSINSSSGSSHFGYIFGAKSSAHEGFVPDSLTTVTITGGSTVGYSAFYKCYNIVSITLPKTITTIYEHVFNGCSSLKTVNYCGDQEDWYNIEKKEYWNYNTPNFVVHCNDGNI